MTDRRRFDPRRNESDRGRDLGSDDARFGSENDGSRYGSERWNDQDDDRLYNQDGNRSRQRFSNDRDVDSEGYASDGTDFDRSSSPFRSGSQSVRQFQPTVSPFRGRSDDERMARTSRGGGRHLGSQMSDSIYGRDEPYQGNRFASGNRSSGGFAGKGPKGYARSDERIKEEICDCLADDDHIDASDIEVQVSQGEVTLTGTVSERRAKRLAEDVAEGIRGVKDVHNQIRIQSASQSSSTARMSDSSSESVGQSGSQHSARMDQTDKDRSGIAGQKSKTDNLTARH